MKYCASEAEPPLPQARILPSLAREANTRSTAADSGAASSRELVLKASIASLKCDVMCDVMSMTVIISCSNKNHVMGSNSAVGARLLRECVFYPDQAFRFDADHVEATGRGDRKSTRLNSSH